LDGGDREVKLLVAPCTGYNSTDAFTGWKSVRTMLIMEMVPINRINGMASLEQLIPLLSMSIYLNFTQCDIPIYKLIIYNNTPIGPTF